MSLIELMVSAMVTSTSAVLLVSASKQLIALKQIAVIQPAEQIGLFLNRCQPLSSAIVLFHTPQMLIWHEGKTIHGFLYRPQQNTVCWIDAHDNFKPTIIGINITNMTIATTSEKQFTINLYDQQTTVTVCFEL